MKHKGTCRRDFWIDAQLVQSLHLSCTQFQVSDVEILRVIVGVVARGCIRVYVCNY
eukprot:COSAG02_NODE_756_length_17532_cov_5.673550_4_plen_56_part_00